MARNTYSTEFLDGAGSGLSRLAQAIGGGQQAYQGGYDQGASAQSKIALALAQIRNQQSEAGAHDATAAETRAKTGVLAARPDLFRSQVANLSGVDGPTVDAYQSQLSTGKAPLVPMGPPTEDGQSGVGSFVLPDATRSKLASAFQQFAPLLANTGDVNAEQMAKAAQLFRQSGLSDDIIAGRAPRDVVAGAQAAAGGKAAYTTSADGAVLDQYGGRLATDNPLARSTIGLRNAQAGQASAHAALSRAQADAAVQGGKGVIQQTDDGMVLVNPKTGTAVPITGPDGVQVAGKSAKLKDIPPTANKTIIDGQQQITNIDEAIQSLADNPNAGGWTNSLPFAETVKQMWATPGDVMTRGQVANIGSLVMHDRSGASVTVSESPRLKPFIPSVGDSNKVAAEKLGNMKRIAEQEMGLYSDTYSPGNGYRPSPILTHHQNPAASPNGAHPNTPAAPGRVVNVEY